MTSKSPVGDISVVTLIRTDTTLDHSQKAEKVCSVKQRWRSEKAVSVQRRFGKTALALSGTTRQDPDFGITFLDKHLARSGFGQTALAF